MEAGVSTQELGIVAKFTLLKNGRGTSLLAQWLRLNARDERGRELDPVCHS